jgi:hypothetical protein
VSAAPGTWSPPQAIFRSPVQNIRVGERSRGVIQPLSQDEVDQAEEAAATPAARLVLVLAAMHDSRFMAIREIRLDDVDLGNRRISIGGRPLDDVSGGPGAGGAGFGCAAASCPVRDQGSRSPRRPPPDGLAPPRPDCVVLAS